MDGKGNSKSDFNENCFEKTQENQEQIKVFTVLGKSMFDIIKPNTDVLVREMGADYQYKVGEIVVAKNKDGIKFIHRIEKILLINNKQYIVTKGTNNQGFDNGFITAENIIGVADLSEEAFAKVEKLIEEKRVEQDFAFGMMKIDDREMIFYHTIMEGSTFNDLIKKVGGGRILFTDVQKYLEMDIVEFCIEYGIMNGIDIEEVALTIRDHTKGVMLNRHHKFNIIGKSLYEGHKYRKVINDFCQAKYGMEYDNVEADKYRISLLRTKNGLDNVWNLLSLHYAFNGRSLTFDSRYYQRDRLIGGGKFYRVVDQYGSDAVVDKKILDPNGKLVIDVGDRKYDVFGMKLGWQKYIPHYSPETGGNTIHYLYRHWGTNIGDFKKIGLKYEVEVNEFIYEALTSKTGVNVPMPKFPNTIVYSFYSQKTNDIEYLVIGWHDNDKSVKTAFILDKDKEDRTTYERILQTPILNLYTFLLNEDGKIIR